MRRMKNQVFRIHNRDNAAIALEAVPAGSEICVEGAACRALEEIPRGHKIALADIEEGQPVVKYGYPIGRASRRIAAGSWIHGHNMCTNLEGTLEYEYRPTERAVADTEGTVPQFMGYRRESGDVGTRNEIWVIPTVSCANHTVTVLADLANRQFGGLCDGIYAFPHNSGCSQLGDDHRMTQRLLSAIVRHPNAGGVLLVSLGCENNNIQEFLPGLGDYDKTRIRYLITQEAGDEIQTGLGLLREIADVVKHDKREPVPVSSLRVAFKCGGSDSLSGVTANPLCGAVTDRIVSYGGAAVLTEVPEMFGAETILMNRADTRETFDKVVRLINDFKQYYLDYGQPVYENPSPGNKEGGITTLEEKSLGCVQKGGSAVVTDTLDYGEQVKKAGLNLMTGPGNDNVSITDLVASGAQILLFTTGRGNPLGTAIPCIKLSSNTALFNHKRHWIDFDAGTIVDGISMEALADQLWQLVLEVASGRKTQSEQNGFREIMLFKNGVLL